MRRWSQDGASDDGRPGGIAPRGMPTESNRPLLLIVAVLLAVAVGECAWLAHPGARNLIVSLRDHAARADGAPLPGAPPIPAIGRGSPPAMALRKE